MNEEERKGKDLGRIFSDFETRLKNVEEFLTKAHGESFTRQRQLMFALPTGESLGKDETEQALDLAKKIMGGN